MVDVGPRGSKWEGLIVISGTPLVCLGGKRVESQGEFGLVHADADGGGNVI